MGTLNDWPALWLNECNEKAECIRKYALGLKKNGKAVLLEMVPDENGVWQVISHKVTVAWCDYEALKAKGTSFT